MKPITKSRAQLWLHTLHAFNTYLSQEFLGGPKRIKLAWVINLHKGGTIFIIALLMLWYRNNSTEAWIYLALHGTYGLCWLLKHRNFPDPQWERRVTFGGALAASAFVLGPYWLFPYLLISGTPDGAGPAASNARLAICISLHTLGIVLMMSADSQKYYTLKYQPGLIEEGLFKQIRHPNYLGEMLIYGAYALLVQHWLPWVILACIWIGYFLPNMLMKEQSLARYPGWEPYKARTTMLLPWSFARHNAPGQKQQLP
jgi:steroid 5-alpha reductase family enzyme